MEVGRWRLEEAAKQSLAPHCELLAWGSTVVLAPHPDDEALGAGGAIALLRRAGIPVTIVWLTDGAKSHPHSPSYPAGRLVARRQEEARAAAAALGVASAQLHFLGLPDSAMPWPPPEAVLDQLRVYLAAAQTVVLPWRLDPHCDHRATYAYFLAARAGTKTPLRTVECPVWLWQNGRAEDFPRRDEFTIRRWSIETVLPQKRAAIAAHRSQVSDLISDDPQGFRVPAEMLAHFGEPWELFIEAQ